MHRLRFILDGDRDGRIEYIYPRSAGSHISLFIYKFYSDWYFLITVHSPRSNGDDQTDRVKNMESEPLIYFTKNIKCGW
jgi:hypothetical protein